MKKATRIIVILILLIAILSCSVWYLFSYDREFTRDALLNCARFCESNGNHKLSAWFYNKAYSQVDDNDAVAIELAQQYLNSGNYTKAEYTLSNAITDGGGVDVYIALSKVFIEQDKLRDAVLLLDGITNESIKEQLDAMRPTAPTITPDPGYYNQYISVTLTSENSTIYASLTDDYPSLEKDLYADPITLSDGENSIRAIAVSDNGLVSSRVIYGYTIGGVVEKVEFTDPVIEEYVRTFLNAGEKTVIYTKDLWAIKELTIPADVLSYSDLRHMINLEKLVIEDAISDELQVLSGLSELKQLKITNATISDEVLTSIGTLPDLEDLEMTDCSISSITPLKTAVNLKRLNLSGNTIRNLEPLSALENLTELHLQHNAVNDLSPLSNLVNLTYLDVSYNALERSNPIYSATNLQHLDLSYNNITDLGSINTLTALEYLSVSGNTIADISQVAQCTALTELYASNNQLTDITMLGGLDKLMHLDISHNQVVELPAFSKECALVTINGSHNLIESLATLEGLPNLNKVHMDYNEKISSVAELATCPLLVEVNVYATSVTDVTMLTNQSIIVNYNPVNKPDDQTEEA